MSSVLFSLLTVSFLSATLLPGTSEAALSAIIATGSAPVASAVVVATIANTAGSVVNWAMGRFFTRFQTAKWFPLKPEHMARYQRWYNKWGIWTLLLSWAPVIGDPLTAMAGIARAPLWLFVPIVTLAKATRYVVVAGLIGAWIT